MYIYIISIISLHVIRETQSHKTPVEEKLKMAYVSLKLKHCISNTGMFKRSAEVCTLGTRVGPLTVIGPGDEL